MERGSFGFEVNPSGLGIRDCPANVDRLRALWLDRNLIAGEDLGPGDPGDFDFGAWHVSCHLVAAGGVRRDPNGGLSWVEISYDPSADLYVPTATLLRDGKVVTERLAAQHVQDSTVVGFVEGTSQGRISARGVEDSSTRFNGNPRQDYDQPVNRGEEGGRVWEHWCTLRDIRELSAIATSVISSYVMLAAALGDLFPAVVARGRRDYGHPQQLTAMVRAGFVGKESACVQINPIAVPASVETLFEEARPECAFEGIQQLKWDKSPCYYMFSRRIDNWLVEFDPL